MRTATNNNIELTYPNNGIFAVAGNYVRVRNMAQPATALNIQISLTFGDGSSVTLGPRYGVDVVFPLDNIFASKTQDGAIVWTMLAVLYNSNAWQLSSPIATVLPAAQPYGAELDRNRDLRVGEGLWGVSRFWPFYPNLPQTLQVLAFAWSSGYVGLEDGMAFELVASDISKWELVNIPSSNLPTATDVWYGTTPAPGGYDTIVLSRDECTDGYLVRWLDPIGLVLYYRFPKGEVKTEVNTTADFYKFDALLRAIPQKIRSAERRYELSTVALKQKEFDYVAGLLRGRDIEILDLAEYAKDASTPFVHAVAEDGSVTDKRGGMQRLNITLKVNVPCQ